MEAGAAEGRTEGGRVDRDDRLEAGGRVVGEDDLLVLVPGVEDIEGPMQTWVVLLSGSATGVVWRCEAGTQGWRGPYLE